MITPLDASVVITENTNYEYGRFYGTVSSDTAIGVGQIHQAVDYPMINREDGLFDTLTGLVYILTHECDVDPDNDRAFNDHLLICPIIPLEILIPEFNQHAANYDATLALLKNLGKDNISRVCYLPPIEEDILPYGGVIYLNQISNTNIGFMPESDMQPINTVTTYGLRVIDLKLSNHMLRPKAATIPHL